MTPEFVTVSRESDRYGRIDLSVAVAGPEDGSVVVCVHGWPENWWSWHHQIDHLAGLGYRVAAMDVRGYGGSSRPEPIGAYRLVELCGDVAAVCQELSTDGRAVVVGHDWGAPIAWNTARLHPEVVHAVAGMSVPYGPASPGDPMELWSVVYEGRFFYMKYFQEPGVAEASLAADVATNVRKVYYAASGDSPNDIWLADQPEDADFFELLVDPDPIPEWMSGEALQPTIDALSSGSNHGAFHRYRAQKYDGDDIAPIGDPILQQPTCFIAGELDVVRSFVRGVDVYADAGAACADFRGSTIIDGAGHWVQQEKPRETNVALQAFLEGLEAW